MSDFLGICGILSDAGRGVTRIVPKFSHEFLAFLLDLAMSDFLGICGILSDAGRGVA